MSSQLSQENEALLGQVLTDMGAFLSPTDAEKDRMLRTIQNGLLEPRIGFDRDGTMVIEHEDLQVGVKWDLPDADPVRDLLQFLAEDRARYIAGLFGTQQVVPDHSGHGGLEEEGPRGPSEGTRRPDHAAGGCADQA